MHSRYRRDALFDRIWLSQHIVAARSVLGKPEGVCTGFSRSYSEGFLGVIYGWISNSFWKNIHTASEWPNPFEFRIGWNIFCSCCFVDTYITLIAGLSFAILWLDQEWQSMQWCESWLLHLPFGLNSFSGPGIVNLLMNASGCLGFVFRVGDWIWCLYVTMLTVSWLWADVSFARTLLSVS